MKTKTKKVWTYKDFLEGKLKEWEEIVNGKRIKKMPAYKRHGKLLNKISNVLTEKLENEFEILVGEIAIKIDDYNIRAADIVLIKRENYKDDFEAVKEVPDLIIEIEDSKKSIRYIKRKISDYLKFGIKRQIWIFLDKEEIWDIDNLGNKKVLSFDDEIDIFGVKFKIKNLL
ncbi:MAG: Uma2 family endonuclease [candidate division WOR-3 bacterium]